MARETKVGLLAGLAFIICFAIILSNRGRPVPVASYEALEIDAGVGTHGDVPHVPPSTMTLRTAATQPAADRTDAGSRPATVHGSEALRPTPSRLDAAPTSGANLVLLVSGDDAPEPSQVAQRPGEASDAASIAPSEEQAARRRELAARLDALSAKMDAVERSQSATNRLQDPASAPAAPPVQTPATTPQPRRYTVVGGDSLSKIVAAQYGTRSRTVVNAIFDANRSVLSSPDVLQVGMELLLPALARQTGTVTHTMPPPSERPRDPQPEVGGESLAAAPFEWYQVRKGDRYIKIAREQLGDARRWREIFELNSDKFPDPQQIREGVRIKIPKGGAVSSTEARR